MSRGDIADIMKNVASLDGALLGIVLTLIVFVPALIEIIRVRTPGFLSERHASRAVEAAFKWMIYVVWLLAVAMILGFVTVFFPSCILMGVTLGTSFLGLILLVAASLRIAYVIQAALRPDR